MEEIVMSNCESCPSKGNCNSSEGCSKILPKYGSIKNIIGVISGKGGVGKSTVTGILAAKLRKAGLRVGVLDADITGPSMPRFFGISDKRAEIVQGEGEDVKFEPVLTSSGIKVISLNLLTQEEEQPVIWRGPVINGVLTQMFTDTVWGELDYLLIDMPPGTGDVALTIMQSVPVQGLVVVSTPQEMVSMIVKKAIIMAQKLEVKILGVVENMSYINCSKCGERMPVFSRKSASEQAEKLGIRLLAEMPVNLEFASSMEIGEAESYSAAHEAYDVLYKSLMESIKL
jgi:ATP-binding protein involved in chromosome partitioning